MSRGCDTCHAYLHIFVIYGHITYKHSDYRNYTIPLFSSHLINQTLSFNFILVGLTYSCFKFAGHMAEGDALDKTRRESSRVDEVDTRST